VWRKAARGRYREPTEGVRMAFDVAWLRADRARALAAAPTGWRVTRFPAVPLALFAAGVVALVVIAVRGGAASGAAVVLAVASFVVAVICGVLSVAMLLRRRVEPGLLRLHLTAAANGYTFTESGLPEADFALLHAGDALTGSNHFANGAGTEFGSLSYTTGNGKSKTTHPWHYVIARLPAALPHLILDARSNDFLGSDLPSAYSRVGRLSLEGDFDSSFRLYAPIAYQQDALYVLTPDVMALLIDEAAAYNIEIIDDLVVFFSEFEYDFLRPGEWAEVDRLLSTVVPKLADRAARWAHQL
jgi:hypothetical protein